MSKNKSISKYKMGVKKHWQITYSFSIQRMYILISYAKKWISIGKNNHRAHNHTMGVEAIYKKNLQKDYASGQCIHLMFLLVPHKLKIINSFQMGNGTRLKTAFGEEHHKWSSILVQTRNTCINIIRYSIRYNF